MRHVACGIVALSLLGGCASTELCPPTGDTTIEHMTVRHPGDFYQVALDGPRMFGPDFEVMRYDDAYRGWSFRKQIDLRVQEDLIEGMVGTGGRTELHLERYPDGFQLQGLYAGNIGGLIFRRDRLEGQLGGRVFRLRNRATDPLVYESPSGPAERAVPGPRRTVAGIHAGPTEINLPGNFGMLPVEHQAALLALFLGR